MVFGGTNASAKGSVDASNGAAQDTAVLERGTGERVLAAQTADQRKVDRRVAQRLSHCRGSADPRSDGDADAPAGRNDPCRSPLVSKARSRTAVRGAAAGSRRRRIAGSVIIRTARLTGFRITRETTETDS